MHRGRAREGTRSSQLFPGREKATEKEQALQHLDLGLPASRAVRNPCLLLKLQAVSLVVAARAEWC